ncbi:hypothetical protein JKP88DRAFT_315216 [Tribonema minus]|uniref:MJ1316 RNA cyclic group end recognition domain-containing protein n=1 Tax=Tribonema minus TaxID=303371 RepID=A0A836CHY2_9STRA|nr:hypothetical protein JKP88DRAFT_315216 [Tribonema minus]
MVGYLDRFHGVQEANIAAPNLTVKGKARLFVKAIPQARIVYIKYKTRVVWDRELRLDLVFGTSSNGKVKIEDAIQEYEAFARNSAAAGAITAAEAAMSPPRCSASNADSELLLSCTGDTVSIGQRRSIAGDEMQLYDDDEVIGEVEQSGHASQQGQVRRRKKRHLQSTQRRPEVTANEEVYELLKEPGAEDQFEDFVAQRDGAL